MNLKPYPFCGSPAERDAAFERCERECVAVMIEEIVQITAVSPAVVLANAGRYRFELERLHLAVLFGAVTAADLTESAVKAAHSNGSGKP